MWCSTMSHECLCSDVAVSRYKLPRIGDENLVRYKAWRAVASREAQTPVTATAASL